MTLWEVIGQFLQGLQSLLGATVIERFQVWEIAVALLVLFFVARVVRMISDKV